MVAEATLEQEVLAVGRRLHEALPPSARNPLKAADEKAMELASQDAELKAALFRFVDVVPACRSLDDLARHLTGFLGEVEDAAAAGRRRDADGQHARRPHRARRRRGGRRQAHGAPLHRRREPARPRSARCATCGRTAWRAPSTCSARRRSPRPRRSATPSAATTRSTRSPPRPRSWPERPALERDSAGAAAAREPLGQGLRAHAAAAPRRARARQARRRRPAARAAAPRARGRRPPAHRHGVARLARRGARARARAARRGRSSATGPSAGMVLQAYLRDSPETLDTVLDWAARRRRRARAPADRAARQGRLLGPRDRRGRAARLDAPGVRGQGRLGPQLRGADAAADRRAAGGSASRSPRTTCARSRTRSPTTGCRRRRRRTSSCRSCAASATRSSTRSPPRACACAPTARSATSWPAWPTSCAACSRTRRNDSFLADQAKGVPLEELLAAP